MSFLEKAPKTGVFGLSMQVAGSFIFIFIGQNALDCILERIFSNFSKGIQPNKSGSLSTVLQS